MSIPRDVRFRLFFLVLNIVEQTTRPLSHKGLWHTARALRHFYSPSYRRVVPVGQSSRLRVTLRDPYWSRLVAPGYEYEPEVLKVLKRFRSTDFAFLDVGANIGYWSIMCTDPCIGCSRVTAIEPMPTTFELLNENMKLNQNRFNILNKAVYSKSGLNLRISQSGENHAGASLQSKGFNVESVTIDDVMAAWDLPRGIPIVIKLDVEGSEIEAFKGMRETLKKNVIMIYEDHGNERHSNVTRFAIEQLVLDVYFMDDKGGVSKVADSSDATAIKTNRKKGYNFIGFPKGSALAALFPEEQIFPNGRVLSDE